MKIEAAGNTLEQAEHSFDCKKEDICSNKNVEFGEKRIYGNFELGYKIVQYYDEIE